ncbi:MAG: hypothetical protein HDS70_08665 [Bacteroidales bacterium]|nr:hypothetical protein [Bacteroidales bacterium]
MKCFKPIFIEQECLQTSGELKICKIPVPCGKCPACLSSRSDEWIVRLSEEVRSSDNVTFFTLTYDDDHLPWQFVTDKFNNVDYYIPTTRKSDVQAFMKRLRKKLGNGVRFFVCSEFGPTTLRPHYHGLLFNVPQPLLRKLDDTIFEKWQNGFTSSSKVSPARVAYVAKYCNSFASVPGYYPRPFILCSLRPAIGSSYLERSSKTNWHKKNLNTSYIDENGFSHKLPRYYKRKIFDKGEFAQIRENYLDSENYKNTTDYIAPLYRDAVKFRKSESEDLKILLDKLADEEDWRRRKFESNFNKKLKKRKV